MSLYCHKNSIGNFYKRRGIIKKTEGQRQQRLKIKDQGAGAGGGDFMSYRRKENAAQKMCPGHPSRLPEERRAVQAGALVPEAGDRHWGPLPLRLHGCPAQREAVHRRWPERGSDPHKTLPLLPWEV